MENESTLSSPLIASLKAIYFSMICSHLILDFFHCFADQPQDEMIDYIYPDELPKSEQLLNDSRSSFTGRRLFSLGATTMDNVVICVNVMS